MRFSRIRLHGFGVKDLPRLCPARRIKPNEEHTSVDLNVAPPGERKSTLTKVFRPTVPFAPLEVFGQNLVGQPALQYRFWANPELLAGKDAVIVVEGGDPNGLARIALLPYFQTVDPAINLRVPAGRILALFRNQPQKFAVFLARGYRPVQ